MSSHLLRRVVLPLLLVLVVVGAVLVVFFARNASRQRAAPALGPDQRLRIVIKEEGLYQLTEETLRAAGLDPQRLAFDQMSLVHQGQPVPFVRDDRSLIFCGQRNDSLYSPFNVYWLQPEASTQPAALRVQSPAADAATTGLARVRFEEQRQYLSTLPAGEDHWLWQPLYGRRSLTVSLTVGPLAEGEASFRISLWSNSSAPVDPDHHVVALLNGAPIADATWDGQGRQEISGVIPAGVLRSGPNELSLQAPGDTGAPAEVSFLDWIELRYPQPLRAQDGRLDFWAMGSALRVDGLPSGPASVWDVTDPKHPLPLVGAEARPAQGGQSLAWRRDDAPTDARRYLIAAGAGLRSPEEVSVRPAAAAPRPEQGADYLAIVHPDLAAAAQPLLDHRASQGLRVFAVSPDALYDAYTYGLTDPAALRAFFQDALQTWPDPKPRFALLVGDASYDPFGYLEGPERALIPSALVQTQFVGQTASDNWLADVDEDGRPDLALGRLPAQTSEQVTTMVNKTLALEKAGEADWLRRALLVADDKEPVFVRMSDELAQSYLEPTFTVERVYLGQVADPHARIVDALNEGVGVVNYIGHGSLTVWAKEKIFSVDDVAALRNRDRLPLLVNMTCLTGYFHHPQTVSLAEALLRADGRGIVAALVPTSESLPDDQRPLAHAFYAAMTSGEASTIGEALVMAKQRTPLERDGQRDVVATFNLLGDPALRLPGSSP